jgi:hypothetical protein
VTTPQDPGDREQPASFPSAPPPPEQQNPYPAPPQQNPYAAPPLGEAELRGTGAGPVGPAPQAVQISFWLWIFVAVLQVVTGLLTLTGRDLAADALRDANTGLTEEQIDTAVTLTLGFYALMGVVIAGLFVWFAIKARAGRNWGRIALIILGVVVLIFQLFGLTWLGILSALAIITAIVLLTIRPSSAFFASTRTR